jgi:cell division protein FtsB
MNKSFWLLKLITQWERKKELNKLETSKEYYMGEISSIKKELADLDNDPAILEKIAREKFYLKRANEDVFVIIDSTSAKN